MPSTRPLSGVTVIEIGHSIAAPYAGMILGELGAEVIKLVADAHTTALGMIQRWGPISLVGLPLSFDGARPPLAKPAPRLGEDNPEIVDRPT
jgi:crotonobetainyl-CoA:carnitine CoA-transferase CaiB-like acyl-CoA transferase